ncbi:unnamed protein product [Discosporangium mesarthrocarpum]
MPPNRRPRRRWWAMHPSMICSAVLLAMAPSLYGFGMASFPMVRSGSRSGQVSASIHTGALGGMGGARTSTKTDSSGFRFAGGTWLKDRVREGKARLRIQVRARF